MTNIFLGRLPLLLEIFGNGFFVLIYTLFRSKKAPALLDQLAVPTIIEWATWLVPLVLAVSLLSHFIRSDSIEDFFRRYIFSLIIFVPVLITIGDIEFTYWLSAVHLFSTVISLYEKKSEKSVVEEIGSSFLFRLKLDPAQVVILSFGGVILTGALLLYLPVAAAPGKSIQFIDALFMSTSATCVTGLASISLIDDFSIFGQIVLLALVQIGGLGIMTLSSSMAIIMGKNLAMREQVIMQDVLDASSSQELLNLIIDIIRFTFLIEFIGAILLTIGFYQEGLEIGQSLYFGFFHGISAFCNAGFALFNNNLEDFKFTSLIHFTISFLIIFGGIGFAVIQDVKNTIFREKRGWQDLSVHTKIVLVTNLALVIGGTMYLFFGEFLHSFADMSMWQKFQVSFFQSVTTRTAGFNTVNLNTLHPHCIYMMILLMFIGASPGSTGGGVKTTTFAILLQSVKATLQGKRNVQFFERTIPSQTVVKSIAIFIVSLITVSLCVLVMMRVEPDKNFLAIFFEVTSAFGTAGMSLGITPFLSALGKFTLSVLMFIGRVGPLTLVLAVGSKVILPNKVDYPDGKVLIG
jgi:trk system potassium uptake protein TrkH